MVCFRRFAFELMVASAMFSGWFTLAPAATALYHLEATISLGGGIKWDYLHFDSATNRVYVSHGTELDVLDSSTGSLVGHVTGLLGSHGIAIDPDTGLGYADSAKNQETIIFDLKTLKRVKVIPALLDADGMVFDKPSNQVYVVGGDANAVMAVNAATNEPVKIIDLAGSPESLINDGIGSLYVNINDKNEIVKIDTRTNAIVARWPVAPCDAPVGLAVDPVARRLFSSCENGLMMVLDADSGKIITSLPIGKGTDSAAFDPATKRAFSSNRDGTLSVIQEYGPDDFKALEPVKTAPGARTLAVDPDNGKVFLVTASVMTAGPPKHPGGSPDYSFKPGTVKALVFAPSS